MSELECLRIKLGLPERATLRMVGGSVDLLIDENDKMREQIAALTAALDAEKQRAREAEERLMVAIEAANRSDSMACDYHAEIQKLRETLKAAEWRGGFDSDGTALCSVCRKQKHAPDCIVGLALGRTK